MSKDNRSPLWMPLYWGDYLRDTMHLSTVEHGAYLLLIGHYWSNSGPIRDDNALLCRVTRLDPKAWKSLRPTLSDFFRIADGYWIHDRIDGELTRAIDLTKARQEAGKRGGKASAKAKQALQQNDSKSSASVAANGHQTGTQPQPQPHSAFSKEVPVSSTLRAMDGGVDF